MSAAKHTPGPWKVAIGKVEIAWQPDAICLLEFSPDRAITVKVAHLERVLSGAREADARLIAAAPALLEALEKLRNETLGVLGLSRHEIRLTIGNTNFAVLQARLDEAEAAIRQAKGELTPRP